jgi:hypothetical protein
MAVNLAFNAVLARISRFREQANDLEELASGVCLAPVRRKPDRLADRRLVNCHRTSQPSRVLAYLFGALDQLLTVGACSGRLAIWC